jgi:VWFA-related protein
MVSVFPGKPFSALVAALAISVLMPLAGFAQKPDTKEKDDQAVTTLKVNVNVVNLFFNVKDKRGGLVPNLAKDEFEVYEDGKPQTIKYFSSESNQPLTLGLMIDSSASQMRVLEDEKVVGAQFLREVLRKDDLAFVISFDVNVDMLQDYTNDAAELRRAMNRAKINSGGTGGGPAGLGGGPFPTSNNPRGTLLFDAVYLASNEKLAREVGRKAMILLTDGEDQGSQTRNRQAIEAAQKADSIVYVIMIADRGFYGGFGYSGDKEMKKMAEETGGRVINAGNKPEKLKEAFDQIANELRSQYNLGYTPTNSARDGSFRKVEVRVKSGLKVQARQGYYAPDAKRDNGD